MAALIPVLLFISLYIPFLGILPFHDGNTEFRFVYNFYQGTYLSHWMPFHPPAKLFLVSTFFHIFGFSPLTYTVIGLFGGIAGLIAFYIIGKALFDKRVALISTVFLAISGMYLSTAIFNLNDFLVTICVLLGLACYLHKKYFFYGIFASLAFLTKESAIMFGVSVLISEIIFERKFRVASFLPLLSFQGWLWFLHLTGNQLWNDWNFSTVAKHGSAFTIMNNVSTLKIFNKYAYENWLHLFIFNFNWVYWIFVIIAAVRNRHKIKKISNIFRIIFLYFLIYTMIILSFQTFTINRYILPLLPFVYLFATYGIIQIRFSKILIPLVFIIGFISLVSSSDPISNHIWYKVRELDESFYMGPLDGPDGITYNMQFLELAKTKDKIIKSGKCNVNSHDLDYDASTFALFHTPGCK